MAKAKFPVFGISDLTANKTGRDFLVVDRFGSYLTANPHLHTMHRHSFYHLVYFTKGKGKQLIDFETFAVQPGCIYFMNPSQVHQWKFEGPVDGYIINFSATFFDEVLGRAIPDSFPFFSGDLQQQVLLLNKKTRAIVTDLFEAMIREQQERLSRVNQMISAYMIELFIILQRTGTITNDPPAGEHHHAPVYRSFMQLVEKRYHDMRLPGEYASLLYITSNHLNAIARSIAGVPAGEIIRNRVILEAKRLLINPGLTIAQIALSLNFPDNAYFTRFFKKYTGVTPETFRKEHYA